MKINHVINSIDTSTGGPARSVTNLIEALLLNSDSNVTLYCNKTPNPIISTFSNASGNIQFLDKTVLGGLCHLELKLKLVQPDLMHGHGLWQMPIHQMAVSARKLDIPYIISPRGMLDKWSINHKGLKKKIALSLYQRKDLEFVSVFHATSKVEATNIREAGYNQPIAVIPNGVNIPDSIKKIPKNSGKKSLLFLSRLIKNKGIEELLLAWSKLDDTIKEKWDLNIVGAGEKDYEKKLKKMRLDLNLSNVKFWGAAYGKDKESHLLEADLFVLPTYTENFGVAIAEALAYEIPVITTKGAPWEELETSQSGWWIDIGVDPLKVALEEALQTPQEVLLQMRKNGRKLVEEKYSIDAVAKQMLELYRWILEKEVKPEFVQ